MAAPVFRFQLGVSSEFSLIGAGAVVLFLPLAAPWVSWHIVIKEQSAVPTQRPAAEVTKAPTKLNFFIDKIKQYSDTFCTEAAKSAGATVGEAIGAAIPFAAICYFLSAVTAALG